MQIGHAFLCYGDSLDGYPERDDNTVQDIFEGTRQIFWRVPQGKAYFAVLLYYFEVDDYERPVEKSLYFSSDMNLVWVRFINGVAQLTASSGEISGLHPSDLGTSHNWKEEGF